MKKSQLKNIIRESIKELLNELYNCPCYKTCTETFYGVATQTTYVLSNAQAEDCNLNQVDEDGNSIDTCCDSAAMAHHADIKKNFVKSSGERPKPRTHQAKIDKPRS